MRMSSLAPRRIIYTRETPSREARARAHWLILRGAPASSALLLCAPRSSGSPSAIVGWDSSCDAAYIRPDKLRSRFDFIGFIRLVIRELLTRDSGTEKRTLIASLLWLVPSVLGAMNWIYWLAVVICNVAINLIGARVVGGKFDRSPNLRVTS